MFVFRLKNFKLLNSFIRLASLFCSNKVVRTQFRLRTRVTGWRASALKPKTSNVWSLVANKVRKLLPLMRSLIGSSGSLIFAPTSKQKFCFLFFRFFDFSNCFKPPEILFYDVQWTLSIDVVPSPHP